MSIIQTIFISCFLVGIGFESYIHLGTGEYLNDQIHHKNRSMPTGVIPQKDLTTLSWANPFPKNGLGRDFEFFTEDKTNRGKEIFKVKNKSIEVLYDWADSTAPFAMINTIREYSYFNIEFDYKWGIRKFKPRHQLKRDAGILFHVHNDKIVWPSSLECQIQEFDTGDLWVIKGPEVNVVNPDGSSKNIHTRENDYQRNIKFKNAEVEGWNHIRLEIRGAESGKFYVNGQLVNEITDMKYANGNKLEKGNISLQAEGSEISYKNIRIQELMK